MGYRSRGTCDIRYSCITLLYQVLDGISYNYGSYLAPIDAFPNTKELQNISNAIAWLKLPPSMPLNY